MKPKRCIRRHNAWNGIVVDDFASCENHHLVKKLKYFRRGLVDCSENRTVAVLCERG